MISMHLQSGLNTWIKFNDECHKVLHPKKPEKYKILQKFKRETRNIALTVNLIDDQTCDSNILRQRRHKNLLFQQENRELKNYMTISEQDGWISY
jgi:hypothetical protein